MAYPTNKILNHDFETGDATSWTTSDAGSRFQARVYGATMFDRWSISGGASDALSEEYQQFAVVEGDTFWSSGWSAGNAADADRGFHTIEFYEGDGTTQVGATLSSFVSDTTQSGDCYILEGVVPATAEFIRYTAVLERATGTVNNGVFDEAYLYINEAPGAWDDADYAEYDDAIVSRLIFNGPDAGTVIEDLTPGDSPPPTWTATLGTEGQTEIAKDISPYGTGHNSIRFDRGSLRSTDMGWDELGGLLSPTHFSIKFWVKFDVLNNSAFQGLVQLGAPSAASQTRCRLNINSSNEIEIDGGTSAGDLNKGVSIAGILTAGTWHHFTFQRHNRWLSVFVDGVFVLGEYMADATVWLLDDDIQFGSMDDTDPARALVGNMADIQIHAAATQRVGEYTNPIAPVYGYDRTVTDPYYDLTPTAYSFGGGTVTNDITGGTDIVLYGSVPVVSATESVSGGNSLFFTTGGYVELPGDCSIADDPEVFGSVNITLEGWFWLNDLDGGIFQQGASGAGASIGEDPEKTAGFGIRMAGGRIYVDAGGLSRWGSTSYLGLWSGVDVTPYGEWCHIAVVVAESKPRLFINGVETALTARSGTYPTLDLQGSHTYNTAPWCIGASYKEDGARMTGIDPGNDSIDNNIEYVDNLRVTYAARYRRDFTAPTTFTGQYAPWVSLQPQPQEAVLGTAATFTLTAELSTGGTALTYQWYETTAGLISGATSATYVTPLTSDGMHGNSYYCVVSDDNGTDTSSAATLVIEAEWTPADLATAPTTWLDAADSRTLTMSGADVTAISDKSATNFGATAPATLEPVLQVLGNGRSGLHFQAATDIMTFGDEFDDVIGGTSPVFAIYSVMQNAVASTQSHIFGKHGDGVTGDDNRGLRLNLNAAGELENAYNHALTGGSARVIASDETFDNTPHVIGVLYDYSATDAVDGLTQALLYANGAKLSQRITYTNSAQVTSFPANAALAALGVWGTDGPAAYGTERTQGEFLLIDGHPTGTENHQIEGYLAWKWGQEAKLPADHPFVNNAPASATLVDLHWYQVFSLIHCDGTDGATSITDEIPGRSWTLFGNTQIDTAQSKFGGSSLLFDGTGDYAECGVAGDWNFLHDGLANVTVDLWFRPGTIGTYQAIFTTGGLASANRGIGGVQDTDNTIRFLISKSSGGNYVLDISSTTTVVADTWYHLQFIQRDGVGELWIDGTMEASATLSGSILFDPTGTLRLGRYIPSDLYALDGHIEDFRITKAARVDNSTVPTTAAGESQYSAPTITTQPVAEAITAAQSATYTVAATASAGSLTYQWFSTAMGALAGQTSATMSYKIELPNDGDTFYCRVTDSNGSTNSASAPLTVYANEWANTEFLARMEGVDAGTVFYDEISDTNAATILGGAKTDTGFSKWGVSAFESASDGSVAAWTTNPALGTDNFTIEGWVYYTTIRTGSVAPGLIQASNAAGDNSSKTWSLATTAGAASYLSFNVIDATGAAWINPFPASGTTITAGEWHHFAIVRNGAGATDIKIYLDGVLSATSTSNPNMETHAAAVGTGIAIGKPEGTWKGALDGWMDDFRITRAALYTGNFTPPTQAFATSANDGPAIDTQPTAQSVDVGLTATFTVVATGTDPITYQWYEATDGLISGATSASYARVTELADDGNSYYVIVTDPTGFTQSVTVGLTVVGPLSATVTADFAEYYPTQDPVLTVNPGGGIGVRSYQWYASGVSLGGETGLTLSLTDVTLGDNGTPYYCAVTDDTGTVNSSTYNLVVVPAPPITTDIIPASLSLVAGETAIFTASAVGSGTITYQWYDTNSGLLSGETSAVLSFVSSRSDHNYGYYCACTDDYSTQNTGIARLYVDSVLAIGTQPLPTSVAAGSEAVFTVIYTGDGPFSLQWYDINGPIIGETGSTLRLTALPHMAGNYYVTIMDGGSQSITSSTALLTVITPVVTVTDPASIAINKNGRADFEVTAMAWGGISYQWYDGGVLMEGETSRRLILDNVQPVDSGRTFYCVASDGYASSAQSAAATLTVHVAHIDDQTEPGTPSDIGPQPIPTYQSTDFSGLVRAAKAGESPYYDTYRFSGRTFQDREE